MLSSRTIRALALACLLLGGRIGAAPFAPAPTRQDLESLHGYIRRAWPALTRTLRDLPAAAVDPKFPVEKGPLVVYVPPREDLQAVSDTVAAALPPSTVAPRVVLQRLPPDHASQVKPGLLYLPRPYVVPGGRFNEMYGWDSYFILLGLLRDGEIARARDQVDDALYEVQSFGKVLNANRTYYLDRSQPPLLTAMVRAVYAVTRDRAWLARALPAIRTQYQYWTTAPHLAGATGLSRYRALGAGPAPEVVAGERDAGGRTHYDRVRADLRQHPPADLDVARYYDRRRDQLTPLAYRADRSMRESGFDPTDRFGRFSLAILDYAPVCLNSLLYAMETDTAQILRDAGDAAEAPAWDRRAQQRQRRIQDLLWDDRQGLFTDYDFVHRKKRRYPFATTFFPLWVGAASPKQARRVAETALPLLARPGGLLTSTNVSGSQWDAPFAWAPLQLVAVAGLRRYGFDREADRIAIAFLRTVLRAYVQRGAIFEKYDVDPAAGAAPSVPRFGYTTNEIGFGWTNGVFLELEAGLPPDGRAAIAD